MSGGRGASSRSKGVRKSTKGTSRKMASSLVVPRVEPPVICQSDDEVPESAIEDSGSRVYTDDYIRQQQQQYESGQSKALLDKAFRKTLACDVASIKQAIQTASDAGMYLSQEPRFQEKLEWMVDLLCLCEDVTVVVCNVQQDPSVVVSMLPVARVLVHDPLAFHLKVLRMLANDGRRGLWKNADADVIGDYSFTTSPVYVFFRVLGMKPDFRGDARTDPGQHDMLYYKVWTFTNDAAFTPLVGGH